MTDDLKPCPFCGNENPIIEHTRWFQDVMWRIRCDSCGVETLWAAPKKSVINHWNGRDEDCESRGKLMAAHAKIMCLEGQIEKLRQRLDRREYE